MSDVLAIFLILLLLGCAFPGLLTALRLLFPRVVQTSQVRIQRHAWRCLWSGALAVGLIALPVIFLVNMPGGFMKFLGWALLGLGLGLSAFGAAGLVELMASRMQAKKTEEPAAIGNFVRAAVTLELATVFPVVGWLVVFPVSLLVSLGAAVLTWLRGAPAQDRLAVHDLQEAGAGSQAS